MDYKNNLKRGTILPIYYDRNKIVMTDGENHSDITSILTPEEAGDIRHIGRAYGIVKDSESVNICCFCQLHTHSEFSILDGLSSITGIAKKSSGVTAITDHGNIYSLLKWQKAMQDEGKKAIFGSEVYVEDFRTGEKHGKHLILLAKDEIGKKNLFILSSNAFYNFYRHPHVSISDLQKYHEGLICTSACIGGEIASTILDDYESAKMVASNYKAIFGDDYYLEIQRHGLKNEAAINKLIIQLARELDIKIVCANDSHYLNSEDKFAHEILLCINSKKNLNEPHFTFEGDGYHYKTDTEMIQDFWDIPEAIANTFEIADKCNLEIETGHYHMPKYPLPDEVSDDHYFCTLVDKGYEERYKNTNHFTDPEYKSRLEYEKNVIISMGFSSYFLIVWDYVIWAKNHGILVGPGRGSAGGSLVAYCLKITDLDPMEYGLIFERFLNPDRVSMPDIDVDFEDSRRGEVIDYVKSKYGEDYVCNIITFVSILAKTSIRDVGKITGNEYLAAEIKKEFPDDALSISDAMKHKNFSDYIHSNTKSEEFLSLTEDLENTVRQTGVHACGVVISDAPLKNYIPTALVKDQNSENKNDVKLLCSQVTMTEVEELGLLKADFLGLKTLSTIGNTINDIKRIRSEEGLKELSYYRQIPINDPYVYEELSKGKSYAVFQIESAGMRNLVGNLFSDVPEKLRALELKYNLVGFGERTIGDGTDKDGFNAELQKFGDELFERVIAGVALYRPGPMDYIPDYLSGINNPSSIQYDTPLLEEILAPTYGVTVYQEQVMFIVRKLAGFSMPQSDTIRKAMGKKKQEILDEYKPYFIYGSGDNVDHHTGEKLNIPGCVSNGISVDVAEKVWGKMKEFAKYAFNKSHAATYAVITITCAWLKHYYPVEYMAETINTYISNTDKVKSYIGVCKYMGIEILKPDINYSRSLFTPESGSIRFGLMGISGITKAAELIEKDKDQNGNYKSLQDFCERGIAFGLKESNIEALILTGCFDGFGHTRRSLDQVLKKMVVTAKKKLKEQDTEQLNFFDTGFLCKQEYVIDIPELPEYTDREIADIEHEKCNLYITKHPLDIYDNVLSRYKIEQIGFLDESEKYQGIYIAGIITSVKTVYTKRDNLPMAILTVEDKTGSISVTVFNEAYNSYASVLKENACVLITGSIGSNDDFGFQMIARSITDLNILSQTIDKKVYLRLPNFEYINQVNPVLVKNFGKTPVFVQIEKRLYRLPQSVNAAPKFVTEITSIVGTNNIIIK